MIAEPVVSICLISYNQAPYIAQAIESVISQKISYSWELIIADDCSTDGTSEIIKEYQNRHPDHIKPILQPENIGPSRNWHDLVASAKGKYIAYFEADDYWTDSDKLQKQVDFLESHPDYSICFHAIHETEADSSRLIQLDTFPRTYSIVDLAGGWNFIHTVSAVYRRRELPEWFNQSPIGDYPLHMINASYGKIYYMPEPMAVYRKFTGIWTTKHPLKKYSNWYKTLSLLIKHFEEENVRQALIRQQAICLLHMYNNDGMNLLQEYEPLTKAMLDLVIIKSPDQMARFKTSFLLVSFFRKLTLLLKHNPLVNRVDSFKSKNK